MNEYNNERPHTRLGGLTPVEYEKKHLVLSMCCPVCQVQFKVVLKMGAGQMGKNSKPGISNQERHHIKLRSEYEFIQSLNKVFIDVMKQYEDLVHHIAEANS